MLLAMMALMASAGTAAPATEARSVCQNADPRLADSPQAPPEEAQFRRLDELPPANIVLTVLRSEDGCVRPVIVGYGIGAPAKTDK